jgi:hypothetical protein
MITTTSHFPSGYLCHMPSPLTSKFLHCLSNKVWGFHESSAIAIWTPCSVQYLHYIQFLLGVTHSDESFLMWPFQTQQEFTTTWKGFKQQIEMKASDVPIPNTTIVHNCMKRFQEANSILDSKRICRRHVLRKTGKNWC